MNNEGWGLREELVICLVMIVFFGIALISIHKIAAYLDTSPNVNIKDTDHVETKPNKVKVPEIKIENSDSEKETSANYSNLEDKLVSAGKIYVSKYYDDIKLNGKRVITIVRLQTEDILDDLKINGKACSGYLEVEDSDSGMKYFPYIKCGSLYETRGYDASKDNTDI